MFIFEKQVDIRAEECVCACEHTRLYLGESEY